MAATTESQAPKDEDVAVLESRRKCSPCGKIGFFGATKLLFIGTPGERPWFNVLLVFIPLCIIAQYAKWPSGVVFALSLLAMLPLAERLGFCTEELSEHVSDTVAGLMNASMGNAPELIIALFALDKVPSLSRTLSQHARVCFESSSCPWLGLFCPIYCWVFICLFVVHKT